MAGIAVEQLKTELQDAATKDELMGKTAEQIAFDGIATAIIQGRGQEEGVSWSVARSVAVVKAMTAGLMEGREERITSGWNVREEPVTLEEILPFSTQKIEIMVVEALKIKADVAEEASFYISPLGGGEDPCKLINSAKPLEYLRKATGEGGGGNNNTGDGAGKRPTSRGGWGTMMALVQSSPAMEDSSKEEERF